MEWTKELAKEIVRATENLLEGKDEGENAKYRQIQELAQTYSKRHAGSIETEVQRMGTDKHCRR